MVVHFIFKELVCCQSFYKDNKQCMTTLTIINFLRRLFLMLVFDLTRISGKYTGGALAFAATGAFVFSGWEVINHTWFFINKLIKLRLLFELSVIIIGAFATIIPTIYFYFPGTFGKSLSIVVDKMMAVCPQRIFEAAVILCRIDLNIYGLLETKVDSGEVCVSVSK